MTLSLTAFCVWVILASVIALLPPRIHWPAAFFLAAIGIPLLGWVTLENGPVTGLLCLAGGTSILRWPVIYLFRWLREKTVRATRE